MTSLFISKKKKSQSSVFGAGQDCSNQHLVLFCLALQWAQLLDCQISWISGKSFMHRNCCHVGNKLIAFWITCITCHFCAQCHKVKKQWTVGWSVEMKLLFILKLFIIYIYYYLFIIILFYLFKIRVYCGYYHSFNII